MITPSIPDDDGLHADITAPGYRHSSNGQIKLDSKETIKKELASRLTQAMPWRSPSPCQSPPVT